MFFIWAYEIIRRGNEKHLEMDDLSDLRDIEEPPNNYDIFHRIYYALTNITKGKLLKAFRKYIGVTFLISGILAIVSNLLQFSGPLMINRILGFLNADDDHPEPLSQGIAYVCILIGCYLLRTVIFGHAMHFVNLSCTNVMNSANSLVYHKILSLSSASRKYLDTGSIMTHINVDIMSFYYFIMMSSFLFSAPAMIIAAIVLLIMEVGWIGLIAPGMFAIGMFFQNKITKKGF
jgi:ATP-binding cassette, subfamily C (CFTR/MRP), member 10